MVTRAFPANSGSVLLPIGPYDPVVKRVKLDAPVSGETGSPSGVRQSETRRDGRFCTDIGAEPLDRIKGYALRVSA